MKQSAYVKPLLAFALASLFLSPAHSAPVSAFDFGNALAGGSNGYVISGNVSNYTLGFRFQATQNLNVTQLGIFEFGGNGTNVNQRVGIFEVTGNAYNLITSTEFLAGDAPDSRQGYYSYQDVDDVTLLTGRNYVLLATGYYGVADQNPLALRSSTTLNGIQYLNGVYRSRNDYSDDFSLPLSSYDIGANYYTYLGANFLWDNDPQSPASVPEPGSLALLGVGLAGLLAHRRRRRG